MDSSAELRHFPCASSARERLTRGIDVKPSGLEVEHLATLAGLIEHGLGISLVPELTPFQFRNLNLVAIALEANDVMRPILIVRQKNRTLSIAAQGMLELIELRLRSVGTVRRDIPHGP